jgi:hypothetical protein
MLIFPPAGRAAENGRARQAVNNPRHARQLRLGKQVKAALSSKMVLASDRDKRSVPKVLDHTPCPTNADIPP